MDRATISVVIPARNEAGALPDVIEGIREAMAPRYHNCFEVIVVDDGSTDATLQVVADCAAFGFPLRLLRNATSVGKSAAIHSAVRGARGATICTLDGDGQNPPAEVPRLLSHLFETDADLVAGQRIRRRDTASKRWASRLANGLRTAILRDATRDTACGLKAFRRDAFLDLPYFDNMHRYLPALFAMRGYRVAHLDVEDRDRQAGRSNYGNLDRGLAGALDLVGVWWLIHRRKRGEARDLSPGE